MNNNRQAQRIEDDKNARIEMVAAMRGVINLGAMVAEVIEDALRSGLQGHKYSCLHLVDVANSGGPGYRGMLPIGHRRLFDDDRMAFLCTRHPDRLLCDKPAGRVAASCAQHHLITEHQDEYPAVCFTCKKPIPEDEVTPVFAAISLNAPLPVYHWNDRRFAYRGTLHTLPITYLCRRHDRQVDLPIQYSWPRRLAG
ncbi:hypothetical protein [Blastococcus sp. SYSU DS0533]